MYYNLKRLLNVFHMHFPNIFYFMDLTLDSAVTFHRISDSIVIFHIVLDFSVRLHIISDSVYVFWIPHPSGPSRDS